MARDETAPPPYWYGESGDDERGARLMEAMRAYRSAEMEMRRRTRQSMSMGENELTVLRFLTRAAGEDVDVTPMDLARRLGISTASMTALLDRLERSGHLCRRPHPSDRRKVLVSSTPHADDEMRDTLASMHARMMQATRGMTEGETAVVTDFLERMRCAVADACVVGGACCPSTIAGAGRPTAPLVPGAAA